MKRIALVGAFDIANYGDHLFPLVFDYAHKKHGCSSDVLLFAPTAAMEPFVAERKVYSLDNLETMHLASPFDAIVVGGGEIIHWHTFTQRTAHGEESQIAYPMSKIWTIPSFMGIKYRIPILWNGCGVPFSFKTGKNLVNFLCSSVSYLSVRNKFSKTALIECGINQNSIHEIPDTGFLLSKAMAQNLLPNLAEKTLGGIKRYIVFHCNRFIPEEDIQSAKKALTSLHKLGYEIVFLPLAYTHGDVDILRNIKSELDFDPWLPQRMLDLEETISVLSQCELYIGVSLHGAISAAVFGKSFIGFDYHSNKKTKDLFDQLNRSKYYFTDGSCLLNSALDALKNPNPVTLTSIENELVNHFDRLFDCISGTTHEQRSEKQTAGMAANFSSLIQHAFENEAELEGIKLLLTLLQAQKESLLTDTDSLRKENSELAASYHNLINLVQQRPLRTWANLRRLNKMHSD